MSFKNPLATTTEPGVMQVGTGLSVTNGLVTATLGLLNYGFFTSTATQANPVASAINLVTLNTAGPVNGISIVGGTALTGVNAGTETKLSTLISAKTAGGTSVISIWLQLSPPGGPFADVVGSRQDLDLINTLSLIFTSGNFTLNIPAGGAIRMCWSSADTTVALTAIPAAAAPVRPTGNSVKITLTRIS